MSASEDRGLEILDDGSRILVWSGIQFIKKGDAL